jgi:hypothetical protein
MLPREQTPRPEVNRSPVVLYSITTQIPKEKTKEEEESSSSTIKFRK